jgi:hypothetical protein
MDYTIRHRCLYRCSRFWYMTSDASFILAARLGAASLSHFELPVRHWRFHFITKAQSQPPYHARRFINWSAIAEFIHSRWATHHSHSTSKITFLRAKLRQKIIDYCVLRIIRPLHFRSTFEAPRIILMPIAYRDASTFRHVHARISSIGWYRPFLIFTSEPYACSSHCHGRRSCPWRMTATRPSLRVEAAQFVTRSHDRIYFRSVRQQQIAASSPWRHSMTYRPYEPPTLRQRAIAWVSLRHPPTTSTTHRLNNFFEFRSYFDIIRHWWLI